MATLTVVLIVLTVILAGIVLLHGYAEWSIRNIDKPSGEELLRQQLDRVADPDDPR